MFVFFVTTNVSDIKTFGLRFDRTLVTVKP